MTFAQRLAVGLLAVGLLAGCGQPASEPQQDDRPSIVTTTAILADLVSQVGGDRVEVTSIVPPGADPHTYEPSLRVNRDIVYADAAFSNYLLLEPHSVIKTLDANLPEDVPNISIAEESTKYGAEVIPLVEATHLDALWLGLRVRGSAENRSAEAQFRMVESEGPGEVYGYITGTFGKPERFFESTDINGGRAALLPVGGHTHMSWAFTEPGEYTLTFAAFRDDVEFAREELRFAVGVQPSGPALDEGHADIAADVDTGEIYLWVDETGGGDATQRRVEADEMMFSVPSKTLQEIPASADYRFLGSPGEMIYQLPQAVLGAHVHGEIDPHLWLSVPNVKAYIRTITDTLCRVSPLDAQYFRANERAYLLELEALDAEVMATIDTIPEHNRNLVTTHDGYAYLAQRYGLNIAGYVSANSSIEPSIADRQRLTQTLFDLDTPAVFVEPYVMESTSVLHEVAADNGIEVCTIYSDTLDERVPTYVDLMRFNATSLQRCLGKE